MKKLTAALIMLLSLHSFPTRSATSDEAVLYFISPADGQTVTNPVTVRFGLKNMGVAPAGIKFEHTGHHHLLINTDLPALDRPIPSDAAHLHFGRGETETTLELTPGKHTLQLLLGDFSHTPHQVPVISEKITITVK